MNLDSVSWSNITFLFYCFIIVLSATCTLLSKISIKFANKKINISIFILSVILIFVKVFNSTGRDISSIGGYSWNFSSAVSLASINDQGIEFGFKLLMVVVRTFTTDFNIFLIVYGIIYIIPVIYMLNKYRAHIDLFSTVLLYFSVFFFSSFSPIRQSIAASFGLLAFDNMHERKIFKSAVWIIVATLFHSAALVLFIPYFLVFCKAINKKIIPLALLMIFCFFLIGRDFIFSFFSENSRYIGYATSGTGIGLEQLVYYIPIIWLIIYCRKHIKSLDVRISYAYIFSSFSFGMLSYYITIFGRFYNIFLPIIFIVGYNVHILKKIRPKYKWIINLVIIAYCILRFWMYMSQYYNNEDLMPYTNILGLEI